MSYGDGDRVHFLDPDKDSLVAVIVLHPGDRLRVLFREDDVILDEFPTGLVLCGVEP